MTAVLEFVGEPFDGVAPPRPARPALAPLRDALVAAHGSALDAQTRMQRLALGSRTRSQVRPPAKDFGTRPVVADFGVHAAVEDFGPTPPAGAMTSFKPLVRSTVSRLGPADLARLAAGDVAGVFGAPYDDEEGNPALRLAAGEAPALASVGALRQRADGRGRLLARRMPGADPVAATVQAAQVFALYTGLHLCLADAAFVRIEEERTRIEPAAGAGPGDRDHRADPDAMTVEVETIDLIPRPWLRVSARIGDTRVSRVAVALRERPGVPVGPARGGLPTRWLGRRGAHGEHVLLNEFHLTHLSRGDQGIAFGPEFAHYTGRRATRLPSGGLMLVDRVVAVEGERGTLDGVTFVSEYDSPADAWYYADSANASMPNCVYVETSLQAALIGGYWFGATLTDPGAESSLRNLGGTATVLREVDLRDATIRQRSRLESTTPAPGATLQSFRYTLSAGGEPFYEGETMFGYFSDEVLADQKGLDGGRTVPTWLAEERPGTGVRTVDVAARRAAPGARLCSRGPLALLDELTVVDGGGRYGKGYLHARRPIDPADPLFDWHFPMDPVIPGSFGMEAVIQALQEWALDSGFADGLRDPGFVLPVGVPFRWKYRGQFLPTDETSTLEVHVKQIETRAGRVRVTADASMWKPGLRVYELTDVAVELRENGALPW
ncbi:beta-ketoacyl synthase [Streptomyces sp. NPDC001002]